MRARDRTSPPSAFAAAEVSGTDLSRRPEHAPNRSSALVRTGMRLAASGCRLRDEKCFGFPIFFLLIHLISDIPPREGYGKAEPVTGQAAWFDLRVGIARARGGEESLPQSAPVDDAKPDPRSLRYGAMFRNKR